MSGWAAVFHFGLTISGGLLGWRGDLRAHASACAFHKLRGYKGLLGDLRFPDLPLDDDDVCGNVGVLGVGKFCWQKLTCRNSLVIFSCVCAGDIAIYAVSVYIFRDDMANSCFVCFSFVIREGRRNAILPGACTFCGDVLPEAAGIVGNWCYLHAAGAHG